jgi:hypothetical protein
VTGNPIIGSVACAGAPSPRVGAVANNGPAYVLDENGVSCYGRDAQDRDIPLQTDGYANQFDHPMLPAVGHPAFVDLGGASPSLVMPSAGIMRALDLAFPEYQRGQDFVAAWTIEGGGQLRPGFPAAVNDLQFLTGPSGADIDGLPGEELVAGTASKDLQAFDAAGEPAGTAWPKVTTDWTVANPLIGSFGTLDVDSGATKVVVGMTRSGYLNAYATAAPACSPASWPRFHHDNANSGDYGRDATLPGAPFEAGVTGTTLEFRAPGDDLLCGAADHYEIVTSPDPIDAASFDSATPLGGAPDPAAPGTPQTYSIPPSAERYVGIRAVDDQGNVGRPAVVDLGPRESCANKIIGTSGDDVLTGTGDSDRIGGRRGDDELSGRGGDDCVAGHEGDDTLFGGLGGDKLKAGRGTDAISGGDGDDLIRARAGRDTVNCGGGDDVVFADAQDDVAGNCETVHGGP